MRPWPGAEWPESAECNSPSPFGIPMADPQIPRRSGLDRQAAESDPGGGTGTRAGCRGLPGGGMERRKEVQQQPRGERNLEQRACAVFTGRWQGKDNGSPVWCCAPSAMASGWPSSQFIKGRLAAGRGQKPLEIFADALVLASRWGKASLGNPDREQDRISPGGLAAVAAPSVPMPTASWWCSMKSTWP